MEDELVLTWRDVSANTFPDKNGNSVKMLNEVSGTAKSNSLTAIISPSGAGKTTLLAILNQRFKGVTSGSILLNGYRMNQKQMARISGFVRQTDCIFDELTMREHLEFMARLKISRKVGDADRKARIKGVLEDLSLSHRYHVEISKLSGGQRKRLSLAIQLLTEPRILFCDEPTTGLDSYSAIHVMSLLRKIANDGKLIVCSIHQPASGVFEMFDQVSLLAAGGSLAYHGNVSDISNHFSKLGLRCPKSYNLCEFIVSKVTARSVLLENESVENVNNEETVQNIVKFFKNSSHKHLLDVQINHFSNRNMKYPVKTIKFKRVSFVTELLWLYWRSMLLLKRSMKTYILRFFLYLNVMFFVAMPYGRIEVNQTGIQNIQGLFHCVLMDIVYCAIYGVIFTFPEEMPVFLQDAVDHVYSPFAYYLTKILTYFPRSALESFIYAHFVFWITGLNTDILSFHLIKPLMLGSLVASAYGFFLSTTFNSITTASIFAVPFEIICTIFGGIMVRLRSLPWYTVWLKYISHIHYIYEALSIEQWTQFHDIPCDKSSPQQCYTTGRQVLESYSFTGSAYIDYIGLAFLFFTFHALGYLSLLRRTKHVAAY